jgi:hypothetical protein
VFSANKALVVLRRIGEDSVIIVNTLISIVPNVVINFKLSLFKNRQLYVTLVGIEIPAKEVLSKIKHKG